MALRDIEKDLYRKDSSYAKRSRRENSSTQDKEIKTEFSLEEPQSSVRAWFGQNKKAALLGGGIVFFVVVVIGILLFVNASLNSFFNEERVTLSLSGSEAVESNVATDYSLSISNNNRAQLEDIEILVTHGENFRIAETSGAVRLSSTQARLTIPLVESKGMQQVRFSGDFVGPKNHVVALSATVRYRVEKTETIYEKTEATNVRIVSAPVSIDVEGPLDAVDGDEVNYIITYRNNTNAVQNNQRIRIDVPQGLTILNAQPQASLGANMWQFDALSAREEGTIRITGRLAGRRDEIKTLSTRIGVMQQEEFVLFDEKEHITRMVSSPLLVRHGLRAEGRVVSVGDVLDYEVSYRNEGTIGLRDVVLTIDFDTDALDFSRLALPSGSFDGSTQRLTWKAVDVAEFRFLDVGAEGNVTFSVPVKNVLPIADEDDRNFTIVSTAQIDSPDVPTPVSANKVIASNTSLLKVQTPFQIAVEGFYSGAVVPNTGPIPPRVGQETTYNILWSLINPANDASDVIVKSGLPGGILWKDVVVPDAEDVSFNERTNEILWRVGTVGSGTGVTKDKKSLRFQIGLVPSENQVGSTPQLLLPTEVTGLDLFTGEQIDAGALEKTTVLSEDNELGPGEYTVTGKDGERSL